MENIRDHLCHSISKTGNKVMVATVEITEMCNLSVPYWTTVKSSGNESKNTTFRQNNLFLMMQQNILF